MIFGVKSNIKILMYGNPKEFYNAFEIYPAVPNVNFEKINHIFKVEVNICRSVYIYVGTFGYLLLPFELSFRVMLWKLASLQVTPACYIMKGTL